MVMQTSFDFWSQTVSLVVFGFIKLARFLRILPNEVPLLDLGNQIYHVNLSTF